MRCTLTKGARTVERKKNDFQAMFDDVTKTAGLLDKAAMAVGTVLTKVCYGVATIRHRAIEALDERVVYRLLNQYDRLIETGFSHQEALDAVSNLVKRRLETATQERTEQ